MSNSSKLALIKMVHTLVWIIFNLIIFYMLYTVVSGRLNSWLWTGYILIGIETILLLIFRLSCPLTIIARRYSDSPKENFDIYLPNWLAKYNKLIYSVVVLIIVGLTIRLLIIK